MKGCYRTLSHERHLLVIIEAQLFQYSGENYAFLVAQQMANVVLETVGA